MRSNNTNTATDADATAWLESAAKRKYGIHNGLPYVGSEGFIVYLPAPAGFSGVPAALQPLVFQATAEFIQNRIAQPAAKAKDADRESVQKVVNDTISGGLNSKSVREKDPVDSEVERQFAALVRKLVLEKKADATDAQIEAFTASQAESDAGKARMEAIRASILEAGTYEVQRRGKREAAASLGLDISL